MNGRLERWLVLVGLELKSMREGWAWSLGLSALYPASLLFFLKFSSGGAISAAYAVPGCMIFAVVLNTTLALGQELSLIRETASLDFYAILPVSKAELVAAILLRSILFSFPAAAGVAGIGCLAFGFKPSVNFLWVAPTLLVSCAALAGLGAFIGFYAPTARAANFITQTGYTLVTFFSPVMFPIETLPPPLRAAAYFLPTTYAADAMRRLLSGASMGAAFAADLAALALFSAGSLVLLGRRMHWRHN